MSIDKEMVEIERLVDEHGHHRWGTGWAESTFDKFSARLCDKSAVKTRTELLTRIRQMLEGR
jgi:hypothetical protein